MVSSCPISKTTSVTVGVCVRVLVAEADRVGVFVGSGVAVLVTVGEAVSIESTGVADENAVCVGGNSANCGAVNWLSTPILQLTIRSSDKIKKAMSRNFLGCIPIIPFR